MHLKIMPLKHSGKSSAFWCRLCVARYQFFKVSFFVEQNRYINIFLHDGMSWFNFFQSKPTKRGNMVHELHLFFCQQNNIESIKENKDLCVQAHSVGENVENINLFEVSFFLCLLKMCSIFIVINRFLSNIMGGFIVQKNEILKY